LRTPDSTLAGPWGLKPHSAATRRATNNDVNAQEDVLDNALPATLTLAPDGTLADTGAWWTRLLSIARLMRM
jgi:hypothetical protein